MHPLDIVSRLFARVQAEEQTRWERSLLVLTPQQPVIGHTATIEWRASIFHEGKLECRVVVNGKFGPWRGSEDEVRKDVL